MSKRKNKNYLIGLRKGWETAYLRRKPENKKHCNVCGKLFDKRGKKKRLHCSVKCKAISQLGKRTKINYQKKGKIINCENCEKTRYCYPSTIRRFCSIECRDKIMIGNGSPQWRGGLTALKGLLRKCKLYRIWQNTCLKRDKYRCVKCGSKIRLEIDHIIPFSFLLKEFVKKCVDKNNLFFQALQYELLWDINNGRTLCRSCHLKTDTYFNRAKKYELQKTLSN